MIHYTILKEMGRYKYKKIFVIDSFKKCLKNLAQILLGCRISFCKNGTNIFLYQMLDCMEFKTILPEKFNILCDFATAT